MTVKAVVIDREKCIGCGACAADCASNHIELVEGRAQTLPNRCIECGHCFAICPMGAVDMSNYYTNSCGPVVSMTEFEPQRLLDAMRSRRSIRRFKPEAVSGEALDMILEAGRSAPTAKNAQDIAYTVLGSQQEAIERECVGIFRRAQKLASPVSDAVSKMEITDNFFFKGAPLVIVVSSRSEVDASLASSYMEIMAESLGLGVLYSGFFIVCTKLSAKLRGMLRLPDGHKAITCLVVGHPDVEYQRTVPRKPLRKTVL